MEYGDRSRQVDRAAAGDPAAVEGLFADLRPLVLRYCRARLGRGSGAVEAADDAAQEVLIAVLQALPRYRDEGRPFEAFVFGIAAHKVADVQRRASRCGAAHGRRSRTRSTPTPGPRTSRCGATAPRWPAAARPPAGPAARAARAARCGRSVRRGGRPCPGHDPGRSTCGAAPGAARLRTLVRALSPSGGREMTRRFPRRRQRPARRQGAFGGKAPRAAGVGSSWRRCTPPTQRWTDRRRTPSRPGRPRRRPPLSAGGRHREGRGLGARPAIGEPLRAAFCRADQASRCGRPGRRQRSCLRPGLVVASLRRPPGVRSRRSGLSFPPSPLTTARPRQPRRPTALPPVRDQATRPAGPRRPGT